MKKKIRKASKDLENFSSVVKNPRLPASLCILTDCPELGLDFIDDTVANDLKEKRTFICFITFY